jgi:O-antigen/teichoic acid export membrane protein
MALSGLESADNFRKQLPINVLANIANFFINVIIGILLTPYFIGTLGTAAYGLIPLATSLTNYVTILTDSLNTAVSRYLTVDIQQQNYQKANKTFNTALFGLSGIILAIIPVVLIISWLSPSIFNVPPGMEYDVSLLFLGVLSAFLIRSWSSNFTISLFAYNRLDLINLLNVVSILVQVWLIVVFFSVLSPELGYIGLAYLLGSIVFCFGAFFLSRRINPHLHVKVGDFDRPRLDELSRMGWWAVVNQIGSLLFLQIDLIVVNLLFGAVIAGEYAVVFLWATLIRGIGATLANVISPMILTYYAKDKFDQITTVSKSAVKGMGLLIALPIGLVCGFAPQVLTLWVGPEFAHLAPLMCILILPLVINLSVLPLFAINIAFNKVRVPGIITLIMGIGNVLLAFALPLVLGLGYYGVAIAGAIVLTLKNTLFIPWYATKIMEIPSNTFIRSMAAGVLATGIVFFMALIIGTLFSISSLAGLMVTCGVFSVIYFIIIWFVGFDHAEKELFTNYFPKCAFFNRKRCD